MSCQLVVRIVSDSSLGRDGGIYEDVMVLHHVSVHAFPNR